MPACHLYVRTPSVCPHPHQCARTPSVCPHHEVTALRGPARLEPNQGALCLWPLLPAAPAKLPQQVRRAPRPPPAPCFPLIGPAHPASRPAAGGRLRARAVRGAGRRGLADQSDVARRLRPTRSVRRGRGQGATDPAPPSPAPRPPAPPLVPPRPPLAASRPEREKVLPEGGTGAAAARAAKAARGPCIRRPPRWTSARAACSAIWMSCRS